MKNLFRTTIDFMDAVREDLHRPHNIAFERIGFITVRAAQAKDQMLLLAEDYHPVAEEDYVDDPTVGARISQEALRKALNVALLQSVGVFHVHMHMIPSKRHWFSHVDLTEMSQFVPDFFGVCSTMPHGAIVLSPRSAAGLVWTTRDNIAPIEEFNFIGPQVQIIRAAADGSTDYQGW